VDSPPGETGTFAKRYIHWGSKQAVIGPHFISADGTVRTSAKLGKHRLTATAAHLTDPKKVYFLSMEGLLFETM
jgi:hypothetical protein